MKSLRRVTPMIVLPKSNSLAQKTRKYNSSAVKSAKRINKNKLFKVGHRFYTAHPLIQFALAVHYIENTEGEITSEVMQEQVEAIFNKVRARAVTQPNIPPIGGTHGRTDMLTVSGVGQQGKVLYKASEFQTLPKSSKRGSIPPFSPTQAFKFFQICMKISAPVRRQVWQRSAKFLVTDPAYMKIFAFLIPLKASSFGTYSSALRSFCSVLRELHTELANITPFELLELISQRRITRVHVSQVLAYRMLGEAISVRTFNVTVSALKFFWRTILQEELLGPEFIQLENLIKGLRKTFKQDPKGTHVLTALESKVFFQHALDCAKSKQEKVFALSFPIAMRFMLRISEVHALTTSDVHIHEEFTDFTPQTMITIELKKNKSYHFQIQSVSYPFTEDQDKFSTWNVVHQIQKLRKGAPSNLFFAIKSKDISRAHYQFFTKCVKSFKKAYPKEFGKHKLTFHMLRSSEICAQFHEGIQIDIIRTKARHAEWSTTFASYVRKSLATYRDRHL